MRISRGITTHLGGHQPMRTHPMSHILVDSKRVLVHHSLRPTIPLRQLVSEVSHVCACCSHLLAASSPNALRGSSGANECNGEGSCHVLAHRGEIYVDREFFG